MKSDERASLAGRAIAIKDWLLKRQQDVMKQPITGVIFDDELDEWIQQPAVRNFESDLFRRLAIGFAMMQPIWQGGVLHVAWSDKLEKLLDDSLRMRRNVMDANLRLIKDTYWGQDLSKSNLLKEVSRMITQGDYQAAKRWVDENLDPQDWYMEYKPEKTGRGRKGIICRIGAFKVGEERQPLAWGGIDDD